MPTGTVPYNYLINTCMSQFAEEAYGTESKIIVMDFTGAADIYDGLGEKLAGLDIGILGEFFCHNL